MEAFKILQVNNEYNEKYILSTTVDDIYFAYDDIYDILSKSLGEKFSIIVDMLLRNGFTFNRFIQLDFIGEKVVSHILNPREVPESLKSYTKQYIKEHEDLLDSCVLSSRAKAFILA